MSVLSLPRASARPAAGRRSRGCASWPGAPRGCARADWSSTGMLAAPGSGATCSGRCHDPQAHARVLLRLYDVSYRRLARPLIFRMSAQRAHQEMHIWLRRMDEQTWLLPLGRCAGCSSLQRRLRRAVMLEPINAGRLVRATASPPRKKRWPPSPPGGISSRLAMQPLVGLVEFGSFTLAAPGQPRRRHLARRADSLHPEPCRPAQPRQRRRPSWAQRAALPRQYGINIVSPGVTDPARQLRKCWRHWRRLSRRA